MMNNTTDFTQEIKVAGVRRIHGRAMLTLSTGETLVMPRAMLRERPYRSGMPFDRSAFDSFIAERAYPFALNKAIGLLASRDRTRKEIVDSLKQNAYPDETIERVLVRIQEAGYLNDTGFANQWVSSRVSKGMGAYRIRMELRQKGVDSDTIDAALDAIDEDVQLESAIKAARKAANGKNLSNPQDRQKVVAALARRGYNYAAAKQAITFLLDEEA